MHRVDAEFASFDVLTLGKMSSELKPNQAIESEAFELLKLTTVVGCSYEVAARHLNTLQHRLEGSEVYGRKLDYQVSRVGKRMRIKQVTEANKVLDVNGFDTDTLLLRPGVTLDFMKPIVGSYTSLSERIERLKPVVAAYNEGQFTDDTKMKRLELIWKTEGCPKNVMYFFIDEIGTEHQVEHRWVGTRPPLQPIRSSAWVENTVAYILMNGKHFFLTAPDMKEMMRLILAFALEHGLKEGAELVFFSDGANNIKTAIETYFSFYPYTLYLDWFHLTKRIKEDGSRAFAGTIEEKKLYYKEIFKRLWPGNLEEAKNYMLTLPLRNKSTFDKLMAYLDRKSPFLCNYALRKALGYSNASSPVEKANDLLIARRQKHKGMSWSYLGSGSLAIITATFYNGRLADFVHDGTLPFDWAVDEDEEDLAA